MTKHVWYLGLETILLVFVPLYFLTLHPHLLWWRVPVMAAGLLYVALLARRERWTWNDFGLAFHKPVRKWLMVGSLLIGSGLLMLLEAFPRFLKISEFITESHGISPLLSLAIYVLISAPLQEVLFRGFYIARLRLVADNPYFVVVYSGLIFGLVHAPFANKELGLSTMLMGMVWSWYAYKYHSLYPVIFSHALLGGIIMGMTLLR